MLSKLDYLKAELGADWTKAPGLTSKDKVDLLYCAAAEMAERGIGK